MNESDKWTLSQYTTFLVVVMLHMGVLAILLMTRETLSFRTSPGQAVQLLYLPPVNFPKARSEDLLPRRASGGTAISIALPVLDSQRYSTTSAPAVSSVGSGSGVDWAAEARRALNAFEIRNRQPTINKSISAKPGEDTWWPQAQHRAGERFKTAGGNWIVWINANCYQVATSGPGSYASHPQTICEGQGEMRAK